MPDQHTDLRTPIPASPQLDALLDERDHILTGDRLQAETAAVRAAEPRADTKAGNLQSLCSGLLLAGLALLSTGKVPGPAAAAGWIAAALLGVAVTLLTAAARPNLGGDFGFVRWARTTDDQDLLDALAGEPAADELTQQARQLRWLSASLYGKFARIRTAQSLLVTALAVAAIAAALSAIGR